MSIVYLSTAYLAPVFYYMQLKNASEVVIEKHCHYIKQTYRNRCVIATANGLQTLSIPVEKTELLKCLTRDIRVADHGNWQHLHWNAIVSAYRSTPFFEYYEDDFRPFYERKYSFLFDLNEELRSIISRLLDLDISIRYSEKFQKELPVNGEDFREKIHPKKPGEIENTLFKPYYQVFEERFGFQKNLSIIDLLFNMGPESVLFL